MNTGNSRHRDVRVYTINTPRARTPRSHCISPWWDQSKMNFPVLRSRCRLFPVLMQAVSCALGVVTSIATYYNLPRCVYLK